MDRHQRGRLMPSPNHCQSQRFEGRPYSLPARRRPAFGRIALDGIPRRIVSPKYKEHRGVILLDSAYDDSSTDDDQDCDMGGLAPAIPPESPAPVVPQPVMIEEPAKPGNGWLEEESEDGEPEDGEPEETEEAKDEDATGVAEMGDDPGECQLGFKKFDACGEYVEVDEPDVVDSAGPVNPPPRFEGVASPSSINKP